MKFKLGVQPDKTTSEIWFAMGFVEVACLTLLGRELIVTSLQDGKHGTNSLHYSGKALDVRTRGLTQDECLLVSSYLKTYLAPLGFDIIVEVDHIHIEYDPKGRIFYRWTD